jgi:HIV Tat-specific factor 1
MHIQDDPTARLDIEQDIREEASKIGEVTKVVLFDEEPEGVVKVRFTDPAAAIRCVKVGLFLFTTASKLDNIY